MDENGRGKQVNAATKGEVSRIARRSAVFGGGFWDGNTPAAIATFHHNHARHAFFAPRVVQALPCSTSVNATLSRRYTGSASSGACTWPALNSRSANSATCAACG